MDCREDRRRRDPDADRSSTTSRPTSDGPTTCSAAPTIAGAELAVLPEMFNTGYGLCPDYGPYAETRDGPDARHLRRRGAGNGAWRSPRGSSSATGSTSTTRWPSSRPTGELHVYRKRNLVFWERFRFQPGRDAAGRADALGTGRLRDLRRHDLSQGLATTIATGSTWRWSRPPGPTSPTARPGGSTGCSATSVRSRARSRARSRSDLGIPVVFANQCGETQHDHPVLWTRIADRFAGQSSICDGRHGPPVRAGVDEAVVLIAPITLHPQRGLKSWHSTSHSAPAASFSASAQSLIGILGGLVYWRASRRRRLMPARLAVVVLLPELDGVRPLP